VPLVLYTPAPTANGREALSVCHHPGRDPAVRLRDDGWRQASAAGGVSPWPLAGTMACARRPRLPCDAHPGIARWREGIEGPPAWSGTAVEPWTT